MSKKILKRSLALGALMAFVITGQAWAEVKLGADKYQVTSGIHSVDGTIHGTLGNYSTDKNIVYLNTDLNEYKLYVTSTGNGILSGYNAGGTYQGLHLINIYDNSSKKSGDLEVNVSGLGIYGVGTINVDELIVSSGGYAITSSPSLTSGDTLEILANKIVLTSKASNGIQIAGGSVKIGTAEKLVNSITINSEDRPIRGAYGKTIDIFADELNITQANREIKVDNDGNTGTETSSLNIQANKGKIESNIVAGTDTSRGAINMTLGSGVTLTGSVVTGKGTGEDVSSSTLTLNGATWNVTGDSNVTTVAGERSGKIVIDDVERKVEIGTNSNADLRVQASEELTNAIVSGEASLEDVAKTVDIDAGTTTVTVETQETDIAGVSSLTYDAKNDVAGAVVKQVSAKNDAISNAGMALKGHYRAHMNDMNKRMGELRMANGEAGVWTRMVCGESEYQDAKMQYNQYQLGYDEKLSVDKRWTVGAAVTFAEGDSNYGYGSTDDKSTAFAIYGTKLNNDGTFVDLIARYAHLESDIDDAQSGKGDYSTNGYSVSAEFGKRIQQGNGLWIEPQVELTYGTVDSADFRLNKTDKDIHADSMDSFIARVGFSMGKDIKQGNVYARASYLYDFDGETETSFSANGVQGDVVKEDFGGGWWEVGVGANINLSKATYIYADIEKTFGGEVDTNWQWNLGVRYSF